MRRFFIFMIPLCTLFFNCSQGNYGNFLVSFNDYKSGVIFKGVDAEVNTETFYIPETVYGIPVVGIKRLEWNSKKIYAKTLVLPKSITSIGKYSFEADNYPSLKTIIIKGNIEDLDVDAFYTPNDSSYTIVFLSTTDPPKISQNNYTTLYNSRNLKFYVPDESVDKYKKATVWSNLAAYISPLSKYSGTLP